MAYGFDDTMGDVGFEYGHGDRRPSGEQNVEERHHPVVIEGLVDGISDVSVP